LDIPSPRGRSLGVRWERWTDPGLQAVRAHPALARAGVLLVAVVIAYHFTLVTLLDYLRLDTPLAYLPLLPGFTLWTIYVRVRKYQKAPPPIQDRQVDFLIGIPLLGVAILLITVVPAIWSTYYWSERPDVLSMGFFVSAGIILFFGFNWFWRLRGPLFFILLMWPALYLHFMAGVMQSFTDATNRALAAVVAHLPLGVKLAGSPGLIEVHQHSGAPLLVSVGTACSGANSVLGFLLIGGAVVLAYSGRRVFKLAWLATGMALTFVLNVGRLASILGIAAAGQPSFALGAYHAVIGLILFSIAVVVMILLLPLFRLRVETPRPTRLPAGPPAVRSVTPFKLSQVRRGAVALMVAFVAVVAVSASANHDLLAYAAFIDGTGHPTVGQFATSATVKGQRIYPVASYPWAKQYFGANSSFDRYLVSSTSGAGGAVWADVVRTDDRGSLDAYNLENCFLFHNYNISTARRVDVGEGVTALLLNYTDSTTHRRWATVSWAWPIRYKNSTYYERVALTSDLNRKDAQAPDFRPGDGFRSAVIDLWNGLEGQKTDAKVDHDFASADTYLKELAGKLVGDTVRRGTT
jgi:exosortase/archaeosortase family protein